MYVPKKLREQIIRKKHEPRVHGHLGIGKTIERLTRTYYFPGMRKLVEKMVLACDECSRNKASRHAPYGKLQSPETPTTPWQSVAMDFITELPPSKEPMTGVVYNTICVVTDRLTKYAYFIPVKGDATAEDFAYVFARHVFANHGMTAEMITDRDKLFTSKFWRSLMDLLGTNHKLSTAFHPQTDGQTERINQTLKTYLRHYVNY